MATTSLLTLLAAVVAGTFSLLIPPELQVRTPPRARVLRGNVTDNSDRQLRGVYLIEFSPTVAPTVKALVVTREDGSFEATLPEGDWSFVDADIVDMETRVLSPVRGRRNSTPFSLRYRSSADAPRESLAGFVARLEAANTADSETVLTTIRLLLEKHAADVGRENNTETMRRLSTVQKNAGDRTRPPEGGRRPPAPRVGG